jgi:light-regulated signal transduction histidine kinase (bacteriophytochrome)
MLGFTTDADATEVRREAWHQHLTALCGLGLRFLASDIPAQARELYKKNWMRSIPDVDYEEVPVIGIAGSAALDMSFSTLRSVSLVHREYMRRMGVGASISVSLIKDGELWGLLSCGHRTSHFTSREIRTACLSIGRLLSLQIGALEAMQEARMPSQSQARLNCRPKPCERLPYVRVNNHPCDPIGSGQPAPLDCEQHRQVKRLAMRSDGARLRSVTMHDGNPRSVRTA